MSSHIIKDLPYKARLDHAVEWSLANPKESFPTSARIHHVSEKSIQSRVLRARKGPGPGAGGQNRVLTAEQAAAIVQYCREAAEYSCGATRDMVMAAVSHLRAQEHPPKPPPSNIWLTKFLKNTKNLHTIRQRLHERTRLESHDIDTLERWFVDLNELMDNKKIKKSQIWNFDESGLIIGNPTGESVIVPTEIKEVHGPSPANRKSVTILEAICADGRPPPPPGVILPGKVYMENWVHDNLKGAEVMMLSDTGYTNDKIAVQWLEHFIKHTDSGLDKPWKLLLLDGHTSHECPKFVLKAEENNIALFRFPSHLTHILQPLDVGVFRPWKYWHKQAVLNALRNLDLEYNIRSLFRDLAEIREKTFKDHTIKNAFRNSGIWPVSNKLAVKAMRRLLNRQPELNQHELPALPRTPKTCFQSQISLDEWLKRVPELVSSPSAQRFQSMAKGTKIVLARADIQRVEYTLLQERVSQQAKQRLRSRKRISAGGALLASEARQKIKAKEQKEREDKARKAAKAIQVDRNKRKAALHARGVLARKQEKERKDRVKALLATDQLVPAELAVPIRDPEKDPSSEDLESLEPHPSIAQLATEMWDTEEVVIPEMPHESQLFNYSPKSAKNEDISEVEEEDDEWAADYISLIV
jgi:hypothetical protein